MSELDEVYIHPAVTEVRVLSGVALGQKAIGHLYRGDPMSEPRTEAGRALAGDTLTGFDYRRDVLAIEAEARQQAFDEAIAVFEAVDDPGIYPAASPDGPRTHWQDGWNKGVMAMAEMYEAAIAAITEARQR